MNSTRFVVALMLVFASAGIVQASSTINAGNAYAWGANIGWVNGYADGTNGAVMGQFYCTGYIYSANVGWISLGNSNGPVNGYMYSNVSSNDCGVNNVGGGQLSGIAYGANIGWIEFEQNYGKPTVDLRTGNLTGYAYSANVGWIGFSNTFAVVQTDRLSPGPLDASGSGLPIAWELEYFGTTNINPNADADGDGLSNLQEYQAGTNPTDPTSKLRITAVGANTVGSTATLTWTSVPSRLYYVEEQTNLTTGAWATNVTLGVVAPDPGTTTTRSLTDATAPNRFFRVQAVVPLSP